METEDGLDTYIFADVYTWGYRCSIINVKNSRFSIP